MKMMLLQLITKTSLIPIWILKMVLQLLLKPIKILKILITQLRLLRTLLNREKLIRLVMNWKLKMKMLDIRKTLEFMRIYVSNLIKKLLLVSRPFRF